MKIKNIRQSEKHEKNPFRKELLDEFQVVKKREYMEPSGDRGVQNLVISRDGEAIGESRFFRFRKYDPEQFAKVFTSRVTAMWDMPKPASRMFSFVLSILPKEKDEIYLDIKEAMKFCDYKTEKSAWEGIKWLLENGFLAKSIRTNWYFTNTTIFFNGDRAAFVDLIIKQEPNHNPKQTGLFPHNNLSLEQQFEEED